MARIKFSDAEMATYQGYFGVTLFKDGVSVEDVSEVLQRRYGALVAMTIVEDDGSERQGGEPAERLRQRHAAMHDPISVEQPAAAPDPGPQPAAPDPGPQPVASESHPEQEPRLDPNLRPALPGERVWDEVELEAIADKNGIRGLRDVGDTMGVKNTSIAGMIQEILATQAERSRK